MFNWLLPKPVIVSAVEGPTFCRNLVGTVGSVKFLARPSTTAENRSFDSGKELAREFLPSAQDDRVEQDRSPAVMLKVDSGRQNR
jgi:hypothetical protein